jgi:magnesium transporter
MLTATAMGYFEHEIARAVVLALFVPLIISSGGNSGSQASTLVVRSLALGELKLRDWWRVISREAFSGLVARRDPRDDRPRRASSSGRALRRVRRALHADRAHRRVEPDRRRHLGYARRIDAADDPPALGFDPASASAPFVATLVDVSGLLIYFSVASVLLRGTLL